ncbi:hypothetical protein GEMRC1_011895 [Eukaryota sp. GEM-RC1]
MGLEFGSVARLQATESILKVVEQRTNYLSNTLRAQSNNAGGQSNHVTGQKSSSKRSEIVNRCTSPQLDDFKESVSDKVTETYPVNNRLIDDVVIDEEIKNLRNISPIPNFYNSVSTQPSPISFSPDDSPSFPTSNPNLPLPDFSLDDSVVTGDSEDEEMTSTVENNWKSKVAGVLSDSDYTEKGSEKSSGYSNLDCSIGELLTKFDWIKTASRDDVSDVSVDFSQSTNVSDYLTALDLKNFDLNYKETESADDLEQFLAPLKNLKSIPMSFN